MQTSLDILNNIQVASPCSASWDDMIGDEFSRFCNQCEKNVYNLSALTAEAAIQLVREKEGNLCGRFFRRADGTLLTADCPVGVNHRIPRKHKWAVLAASLSGLMLMGGCGKPSGETMGNICSVQDSPQADPIEGKRELAPPPREVVPEIGPPPREVESTKN